MLGVDSEFCNVEALACIWAVEEAALGTKGSESVGSLVLVTPASNVIIT